MKAKVDKTHAFYWVRGRGRPFRRRVAKATWRLYRFLSATLGVRMRGRGPEHTPGTSHRHVKPTARNPTVWHCLGNDFTIRLNASCNTSHQDFQILSNSLCKVLWNYGFHIRSSACCKVYWNYGFQIRSSYCTKYVGILIPRFGRICVASLSGLWFPDPVTFIVQSLSGLWFLAPVKVIEQSLSEL